MFGERHAVFAGVRTAVFITSDSLLSHRGLEEGNAEQRDAAAFALASHAVKAVGRLKQAGFLIIGLGRADWFSGFATLVSCGEFLSASALDDVIIPRAGEKKECCTAPMIRAAAKWLLDLDRSFFICRDEEDLSEAQLTGCTPIRIGSATAVKKGSSRRSDGFPEIVDRILALNTASDERF